MSQMNNEQLPTWEVFIQKSNGAPIKHAGSVHASDKEMALQNARDIYTRRNEGRLLWLVPSSAIVASVIEDQEEFFDPSDDKPYRHAMFYKVPEGVTNI
jgi:ring-1,2-phenylacetyl-CoA epoxidase subunit PaaB